MIQSWYIGYRWIAIQSCSLLLVRVNKTRSSTSSFYSYSYIDGVIWRKRTCSKRVHLLSQTLLGNQLLASCYSRDILGSNGDVRLSSANLKSIYILPETTNFPSSPSSLHQCPCWGSAVPLHILHVLLLFVPSLSLHHHFKLISSLGNYTTLPSPPKMSSNSQDSFHDVSRHPTPDALPGLNLDFIDRSNHEIKELWDITSRAFAIRDAMLGR